MQQLHSGRASAIRSMLCRSGNDESFGMKFWILISYFRSEQHVLQKVLSNPKWRMYAEWYKLMPSLVERQERAVLDSEAPTDLCREALSLSTMKYRVRGGCLDKARGDVR